MLWRVCGAFWCSLDSRRLDSTRRFLWPVRLSVMNAVLNEQLASYIKELFHTPWNKDPVINQSGFHGMWAKGLFHVAQVVRFGCWSDTVGCSKESVSLSWPGFLQDAFVKIHSSTFKHFCTSGSHRKNAWLIANRPCKSVCGCLGGGFKTC